LAPRLTGPDQNFVRGTLPEWPEFRGGPAVRVNDTASCLPARFPTPPVAPRSPLGRPRPQRSSAIEKPVDPLQLDLVPRPIVGVWTPVFVGRSTEWSRTAISLGFEPLASKAPALLHDGQRRYWASLVGALLAGHGLSGRPGCFIRPRRRQSDAVHRRHGPRPPWNPEARVTRDER
jgi:hypothetical protein